MSLLYLRFQENANKYKKKTALHWKYNKQWKKYSYIDVLQYIDSFADSLLDLGIGGGDRLAILSRNRPEWLISDMAINKIGAVCVPIHVMSNEAYVRHAITHAECKIIIVSQEQVDIVDAIINELEQDVRIIVIEDEEGMTPTPHIVFNSLLEKNTLLKKENDVNGQEHDLASILYTSGTTGDPKGVLLTNKNFLSNAEAIHKRIPVEVDDVFLSILPLSHVLERTAGSYMPMFYGAAIAYVHDIKDLSTDLKYIHPSVIIAVPKIFERAYEKIFNKIKHKSIFSRKVFYWALHQLSSENKAFRMIADVMVYRKIRKNFGGRLRLAICGGASMQPRIIRFFAQMKIMIAEGYGLTETSPVVATNNIHTNRIGTVGRALDNVSIRIADDKEILVKGPSVMQGYWKNEHEMKEVFTEDHWFKTGDLGFIDQEGYLTIIGRKKDIIVASNGKNIFPEKIEMEFNLCTLISQSLLIGHKRNFLALLVVPDTEKIVELYGAVPDDLRKRIQKEISKVNHKLIPIERVKDFEIIDESFSIENQQATATLKVRRKIIEAHYAKRIDALYARSEKITSNK